MSTESDKLDVWHYHDGPIIGILTRDGKDYLIALPSYFNDNAMTAWDDMYPEDGDGNGQPRTYTMRELGPAQTVSERDLPA